MFDVQGGMKEQDTASEESLCTVQHRHRTTISKAMFKGEYGRGSPAAHAFIPMLYIGVCLARRPNFYWNFC